MSDGSLIEAVQRSDYDRARSLLEHGHDVHERGEQGWPALSFAAGKGDRQMVQLLLDRGADVFLTGADGRTPYTIAVAASHAEVAGDLRKREEEAGGDRDRRSSRAWETRPYCKAYRLGELRRWPQWASAATGTSSTAADESLADDAIVFVHGDYSVTRSFWHDEGILLTGDSAEWRAFCDSTLGFRAPRDFE